MKVFSSTPFLRILPFSLAGIICARFTSIPNAYLWCPAFCALIILLTVFYYPKKWFKHFWHLTFDATLFFLFFFTTHLHDQQRFEGSLSKQNNSLNSFLFQPLDITTQHSKQSRVKLQLMAIWKNNHWIRINEKVMGILPANTSLKAGILYSANGLLSFVPPMATAADFDYKVYLLNHDIRFNLKVKTFLAIDQLPNLQSTCLQLKEKIIANINESIVSNRVAGLAIALITGYSKQISSEDSEAFAVTGTLHILSVSGLHIGLIYTVATFFMRLLVRNANKKWLTYGLPILLIWVFSFIAGAAPPVLRSSIMCSLLAIAKLMHKRYTDNQVNVLLFSATLLLVLNPNNLYDTGFQLSYSAMLGIFLFQQPLERLLESKNGFLRYVLASISTSIAATLGTLPLSLLLFHQFPPLFIIANLVIVPLSFALLLLCILLLIGIPFSPLLLKFGTELMLNVNQFLAHWGCIRYIAFDGLDAAVLTLFELCGLYVYYSRNYSSLKRLLQFIILSLLMNTGQFIWNYYSHPTDLFYAQSGFILNTNQGSTNTIFSSQPAVNGKFLSYCFQKSAHGPTIIRDWSKIATVRNVIKWIKKRNQMDYSAIWLFDTAQIPNDHDFIRFHPKMIILLKRLKQRKITHLQELCAKFGCQLIDATKEGTIRLEL
jgi:competence protein ComEC